MIAAKLALAFAALALTCPLASAQFQTDPSRGLASAAATALSFRPETPFQSIDELHIGRSSAAPSRDPRAFHTDLHPNGPNFSLSSLFGMYAGLVQINAHSSGNDVMPRILPSGILNLANGPRWMGLVVSVDNNADGLPNSLVHRRRNAGAGRRTKPGADLISYYFEESVGLASSVAGGTFVEQTAEDLGFGGPEGDAEIDALDFAIGVRSELGDWTPGVIFPEPSINGKYYFTLTKASADVLRASAPLPTQISLFDSARPSTIYSMTWSPGSQWHDLTEYKTWTDLDLAGQDVEVDAISIYAENESIIFSTTGTTDLSQLMLYGKVAPGATRMVTPLRNSGGKRITETLGIRDNDDEDPDEVDSSCAIEPESNATNMGKALAIPREIQAFPGVAGPPMGISLTKTRLVPNGPLKLVINVTGWGQDVPQNGDLYLMLVFNYSPPGSTFGPTANFTLTIPRDASQYSISEVLSLPPTSGALSLGVSALQNDKFGTLSVIKATSNIGQIDLN